MNNPVQERILNTAQSLWQFFIDRDKERGLDSSRSERDYLVGSALLQALLDTPPGEQFDLPTWAQANQFDMRDDVFRVYAYLSGNLGIIEWRFFHKEGDTVPIPRKAIYDSVEAYRENPNLEKILYEGQAFNVKDIFVQFYRRESEPGDYSSSPSASSSSTTPINNETAAQGPA